MGKSITISIAVFLLLLIIGFQVYTSIKLNNDTWVYPLDDTYIHMSIGKNLAQYGKWGITKYEFTSSSSSILYTLLIALTFKIAGPIEQIPLYLNIIFGVLIFIVLGIIFKKEHIKSITAGIICMLVLFLSPLPSLIISGMEHTLQILIDVIYLYLASRALESKDFSKKRLALLLLFSALSVMIRFEGIFMVGIISMLYLVKKDLKTSILVFIAGILPIVVFGIYSIQHGAYFIPNSLLMKGEKPGMNLGGLIQFAFGWLDKLKRNPHLLTLFLMLCANFIYLRTRKVSLWSRTSIVGTIVVLTMIIHLTLAKTGWFFRYEAYLMFTGLFAFTWFVNDEILFFIFKREHIWKYVAIVILLMPTFYPLYARGKDALLTTVPATKNIYEQQYQMALFLKKYYNDASVGANDIGAICFFTDIKLFDIFGLGSKEIIQLRIRKMFDKEHIYEVSRQKNTQIAVIYEDWFIGKVPDQWKKAGAWKISDNVILGGDMVSFFATEQYDTAALKKNLSAFEQLLPASVEVLP